MAWNGQMPFQAFDLLVYTWDSWLIQMMLCLCDRRDTKLLFEHNGLEPKIISIERIKILRLFLGSKRLSHKINYIPYTNRSCQAIDCDRAIEANGSR